MNERVKDWLWKRSIFLYKGPVDGIWRGLLYREQPRKVTSGLSPNVQTIILSFNSTQYRVVIGLFIRHDTKEDIIT